MNRRRLISAQTLDLFSHAFEKTSHVCAQISLLQGYYLAAGIYVFWLVVPFLYGCVSLWMVVARCKWLWLVVSGSGSLKVIYDLL